MLERPPEQRAVERARGIEIVGDQVVPDHLAGQRRRRELHSREIGLARAGRIRGNREPERREGDGER
jgi:hypothetical protein